MRQEQVRQTNFEQAWKELSNTVRNQVLSDLASAFQSAHSAGRIDQLPEINPDMSGRQILGLFNQLKGLVREGEDRTLSSVNMEEIRTSANVSGYAKRYLRWGAGLEGTPQRTSAPREQYELSHLLIRRTGGLEERAPRMITEIGNLPTVEQALSSFYQTLSRAESAEVSGNRVYFNFGNGKRLEVTIRSGHAVFERAIRERGVNGAIEMLDRGMDVADGRVVVRSMRYADGEQTMNIYDSGKLDSRNPHGITRAVMLAWSMDFFMNPKIKEFYANPENMQSAVQVAERLYPGGKVVPNSELGAYIFTRAAQLHVGGLTVDGLAGRRTRKAFDI